MSLKQIDAILWRSYLGATSDAVWGTRNSQYYFELPTGNYTEFFNGNCKPFTDDDDNEAYTIILEPFEGQPPAGPHEVTFTKKRQSASRQGKWTVLNSVRDGKNLVAYDLWRRNRGPLDQYTALGQDEKHKNYIIIARDIDGKFHGRWIRGSDFDVLPTKIQEILRSNAFGWSPL